MNFGAGSFLQSSRRALMRLIVGSTAFIIADGFASAQSPAGRQTQWTETVLYNFKGGKKEDGNSPNSSLIFDSDGVLYGTTEYGGTSDYGTVFKLTPPAGRQSQWTETLLYNFKGEKREDGNSPNSSLIFDSDGALYGTTEYGGTSDYGTVFKLTPPAGGQTQWTETVLYSFKGGKKEDGNNPAAGLIFDSSDALYGTTHGGGTGGSEEHHGTVFKLTPPAGGQTQWTETVL
jgi:uncharacterized repeat protein (TIGR03803 family)